MPEVYIVNSAPQVALGIVDGHCRHVNAKGERRRGVAHYCIEDVAPGYKDLHPPCDWCGRYYPPDNWNDKYVKDKTPTPNIFKMPVKQAAGPPLALGDVNCNTLTAVNAAIKRLV